MAKQAAVEMEPQESDSTIQEGEDADAMTDNLIAEDVVEEEIDASGEEDSETEPEEQEESPFGIWDAQSSRNKGFKVLLYGPAGAGKTRYAATFPKPLFLDLESGMRSTLQVNPVLRYPANPMEEIENLSEVREFYKIVRSDPSPKYKTLVVDSLNELQILVTKEVLGTYKTTRVMDDQLTFQDYGKINRVFLNIVRNILKLPFHIVFTAVETPRSYDGQQVYPKFSGTQIWPELQRMLEQIGYVHVIKGEGNRPEHVVSYHLHPHYVAKTRLDIRETKLPNDFESLAQYLPE